MLESRYVASITNLYMLKKIPEELESQSVRNSHNVSYIDMSR